MAPRKDSKGQDSRPIMKSVEDDYEAPIEDQDISVCGKTSLILFWQNAVYYHKQEMTLNAIYIVQMVVPLHCDRKVASY